MLLDERLKHRIGLKWGSPCVLINLVHVLEKNTFAGVIASSVFQFQNCFIRNYK